MPDCFSVEAAAKDLIARLVSNLTPFDDLERQHIQETLTWIHQGKMPLFRLQEPDIPPKHLVVYFVVWDEDAKKILLVDHKKAQLWLPAGGHVELNEHPRLTVLRECREELGIEADFWHDEPLFLTSTVTGGLTPGHIDVSLWYVVKGHAYQPLSFDLREFNVVQWFALDQIPYAKSDPNMKRFVEKWGKLLSNDAVNHCCLDV